MVLCMLCFFIISLSFHMADGPPVIDVSAAVAAYGDPAALAEPGSARALAAAATISAIARACSEWGFFQAVGHGIREQVLDDFDAAMRAFFALPRARKAAIRRTARNSRGWFDDELTKQTRDWKQCLDVGQAGWSEIDGQNQWLPEGELPGGRAAMAAHYAACLGLARTLVRCCAVALGAPAGAFDASVGVDHTSYLRLNHYPPCPAPTAAGHHTAEPRAEKGEGALGINKHTDAGCITVLRQNAGEPASLQVLDPTDVTGQRWQRVVPAPGSGNALTINIGDMMQVWSNDVYVAPLHRVLAHPERQRWSAPFFLNPSYNAVIEPVTVAAAAAAAAAASVPRRRYKGFSWGEFRRRRFEGDFADYGSEVQIADWREKEGGGAAGAAGAAAAAAAAAAGRDGGASRAQPRQSKL